MPVRRLSPSELEIVAPLWGALLEHHGELEPGLETRPASESWPMRLADYRRWLADPGSFALLADEAGEPVGYAVVHVKGPDETWETSERTAELESLAVLPESRAAARGAP